MTETELERIERLFHAASDLAPAERRAYLDRECSQQPPLRARLEAMLVQLESGESLAPPALGTELGAAAITERPGSEIGRYKLLQVIGEGGFGVVYMAEQLEPVRRRVALKIIKLGMDTKEVIARFEAERQALAMMDHPHIAMVLDGGATETGRPYFVMELVRGVSITEYCDENRLATPQRLALFLQVCQAVQHAHQKGVIHRDLKPSNVLVTLHDGVPVPKIIDFGIVKAMHTRLTEKTLFTEYHRFIGTPAYMSPEQAEMSALDVDTRSDIYALGVLLYELLTGSTPFDTQTLMRAGLGEMQRVIREEAPQRPSMRISTQGDAATASRRRLAPRDLSRRLRGDLDWIIMKALEKERGRRYGTASEFAADVQRHLDDEPVEAGPPSKVYRMRKYLTRHRVGVVATAVVAFVLIAGVVGIWLAMVEASEQRDAARKEAENAGLMLGFLADTLSLTDPHVALSPDVSVRTLLDRAGNRVGEVFADNALAEARVRTTIGRAYDSIGENALAEGHLKRAVMLIEGLPDYDSRDFYHTLWTLTHLAFKLDRDDAYEIAFRARQVGHAHIAESHPELAAAMEGFLLAVQESEFERGDQKFAEAVLRAEDALAADDPRWLILADSLMAGGFSLWHTPDEARSAPYFQRAYEIRRRMLPAIHPDVSETLTQLVGVLNRSGRAAQAETEMRAAVKMLRALYPEEHWQVGFGRSMLGECLTQQGRFEDAEVELLAGHVSLRRSFDEDNFYGFDSFSRVVALYDAWGRPEAAEPYRAALLRSRFTRAHVMPWSMTRLLFGPAQQQLGAALERVHGLCGGAPWGAAHGQTSEVLAPALAELFASLRELPADALLGVVIARNLVAWSVHVEGESRRAMIDEAYRILRHHRDLAPLELAEAQAFLADAAHAAGDGARAVQLAREASAQLSTADVVDNWVTANAKIRIARTLLAHGLFAEAETLALPAYETTRAQLGPEHTSAEAARALVHQIYIAWGRPKEAAPFSPTPVENQK